MKDKSNYGIERATVSKWSVIYQLELIALPFWGTYERACPNLKKMKEGWEDAVTKGIIPPDDIWDIIQISLGFIVQSSTICPSWCFFSFGGKVASNSLNASGLSNAK